VVPRTLPHVLSLKLHRHLPEEAAKLLGYVFANYSPRSFAFHEAEYVTLQLLLCLIDFSSALPNSEWKEQLSRYFASIMTEIHHIVEQNGGYFCNEQFELKYNVLLLLVVDGLERLAFERSWREELGKAGLHDPFMSNLRGRLLEKVLDNLDHVTEETEYLLYFIEFAAHRVPQLPARNQCLSLFELLISELDSRYGEDSGLRVTRSSQKSFTFLLLLAFRAFEGLIAYIPEGA